MKVLTSKTNTTGEPINERNIKTITGFRKRTWFRLSGLFSPSLPKNFVSYKDCLILGDEENLNMFRIEIMNANVSFVMRYNIENPSAVHVFYCEFYSKQAGNATSALKYKVNIGRSMGLDQITCNAARRYQDREVVGYLVWGKLGFLMDDHFAQKFKEEELVIDGKIMTYLHELLETPKGEKLWLENGTAWSGYFLLAGRSLSREILNRYIRNTRLHRPRKELRRRYQN